jgi:predicted GNAT family N-acyltransferase
MTDKPLIKILKDDIVPKPFDCGDDDLNDFFLNDAKLYHTQRLSVTYFEENETQTVFFFSLINDRITTSDTDKWNKLARNIPNSKRRKGYPAVKIGRLGINKDLQGKGIGTEVMDIIKNFIGFGNYPTGAKFLTIDAYKGSIKYYEKNGFNFMTDKDKDEDTRAMYFDLMKL